MADRGVVDCSIYRNRFLKFSGFQSGNFYPEFLCLFRFYYNVGRGVVMFTLVDYISRIMSMIMVVSKFIGLMMTSTKQSGEYDCRYNIEIDSG